MGIDRSDLKFHRTFHDPAKAGREYIVRVRTCKSGIIEFRSELIVDAIKFALSWRNKAEWAELLDFERKTIVSPVRMWRLWRAASNRYGIPTKARPYVVRGPTVNPTFMEEYWTLDLLQAVDYAVYWQGGCWNEPYWCEVRGPTGRIVLSHCVVMRMHHAEVKANGGSIVEMVVKVGGQDGKVLIGDGFCLPVGEVTHRRQIV